MGSVVRRIAPARSVVLVTIVVLVGQGLGLASSTAPAAAVPPSQSAYATWTLAGANPSWTGTLKLQDPGFPTGSFTTNSNTPRIAGGTSAFLGPKTPFGEAFGSSQNQQYMVLATSAGNAPSTTTITFDTPTPSSGWGFTLGDVDVDRVQIKATAPNGTTVPEPALGFESAFNYCNATPKPSGCTTPPFTGTPNWDPGSTSLIGAGSPSEGAAGWFRPTAPIKSITLTFSRMTGFPIYQLWIAAAIQPAQYKVTLAARSCPAYTDVSANRARNNLMESLHDLGPDTTYTGAQVVSPTVEAAVQPACTPITNWHFTFGDQIGGAVTGPWGSLSKVSNPESPPPATLANTPLLDSSGNATGPQIAGAVTVNLTAHQVQRAEQHKLWTMGGLVADPVENIQFPGQFGFAALRCATDNLNGDNAEFISFPLGTRHVFCFAYYVKPPPTSGTIVIVKKVPGGNTDSESFNFNGNLSFNPGGAFHLGVVNGAAASQTFIRVGGATWTVNELVPVNWQLSTLVCTNPGGSTTVVAPPMATINLVSGDTVTCTFTDAPVVPVQLTLRKVSFGNVGTFPFTIVGPSSTVTTTATTTSEGVAVDAIPPTGLTASGVYTITEHLPAAVGGTWALTSVECDGTNLTPGGTPANPSVTINAVASTELCTFVNTFTLAGHITVSKITTGAVGTVGFLVYDNAVPATELRQQAVVTQEGVATVATGDSSTGIALHSYTIQELTPSGGDPELWSLIGVKCNGQPVTATNGAIVVELKAATPSADCVFSDGYTDPVALPSPEPVNPAPIAPIIPIAIKVVG